MGIYWKNIDPEMQILGSTQQFIFNQNLNQFQFNNTFVPTSLVPSQNLFELRNNGLSGFRFRHETAFGDTHGALKIQSFVNGQTTGTDLMTFNQNGTINFNASISSILSPFRIQYNAPLTALYLVGLSNFTQAGFVYSNTLSEVLLFSATDLRISSTTGQIHFSLDSGTNDFITFNTQGFKSIVNFISNNPDTSGLIPEKGYLFEVLNVQRAALVFNKDVNTLRMYTQGNDGIAFGINQTDVIQILTSGNLDLISHRIVNVLDPVNLQDVATKAYVDNSNTQIPSLINVTGSTQTFLYSSNHIASFITKNNTAPTSGNPSSISLDLINNTNAGYRLKHEITNIDLIGNIKLLYTNNFGDTSFFTASFSSFSIPQVTFNANLIASGNSTFQYCAFNVDAVFNQGAYVQTPTLDGHATNKLYVDTSFSNFVVNNPVTLTGAITGTNSINNPIFTSFSNTIPVNGTTQTFNFSLNSNAVYRLVNTLAATTGTPSTIALSLNNATTGGFRFLHTINSTDPSGLGTLKLQILNQVGGSADVCVASINTGSGITDMAFGGTATFNGGITVQNNTSVLVTGNSSIADYLVMNNTNLSGKTQLRINVTGLPVATFGFDGVNERVYIDSPFGGGYPFAIAFGGNVKFYLDSVTGNLGLGTLSPHAALQFGNVVTNRRIVLYETANNDHQYFGMGINAAIYRFQIDGSGSNFVWYAGASASSSNELMRLDGNANLSLTSSQPSNHIYVNNTSPASFANDIFFLNNGAFGVAFGLNNAANEAYVWAYGSTALKFGTGATERLRITPTGLIGIGTATPNAPLQFSNATLNRKIVLFETNNNDHQYYGFGINNGILRYQIDATTAAHVFYAATSSTTSNEVGRITGTGDFISPGTIYVRRVSGSMTMQGNAIGTTVTTGGLFYKVAGTTASSNLNGLSSTSNRLTWTSATSGTAIISLYLTASHNGGGGDEIQFAIYKNGIQIANSIISGEDSANRLTAYSLGTIIAMALNDYIELYCSHPVNGKIITVKNMICNFSTT